MFHALKKPPRGAFRQADATFERLESQTKTQKLETATLAGGCFWCIEAPFQDVEGVIDVLAGYSGGSQTWPNYLQVARQELSSEQKANRDFHREAVRIWFDPNQISYQELLDIFWLQIDPTDPRGQFYDQGPEYMTAIFFEDEDQHKTALKSRKELDESGKFDKPIATEILPFSSFWPAEDEHQQFAHRNPVYYQRYKQTSGIAGYQANHPLKSRK